MDENPGATPNPLGAASGSNPEPTPTQPTPTQPAPAEPAPAEPAPAEPATAETAPSTPVAPVVTETPTENTTVESLDPNGRPMEKAGPAGAQPAKKKTGLIVGIIVGVVVLIGAIVAIALAMMNMNKGDVVAQAMQKLISGGASTNLAVSGNIDFSVNTEGSPIKHVKVDLKSDLITNSLINNTSAVLSFTTNDNKDFSIDFAELYAANGDLYFKIEGITSVLEDSDLLEMISGGALTSGATSGLIDIAEMVDGVWLKLSTEELTAVGGNFVPTTNPTSCLTDLASEFNKNSNATAELYGKYPFVTSTTEKVTVPGKPGPVYQVSLDSKNFTSFVNSQTNSELMKKMTACFGSEENVTVNEEEVANLVAKMPKLYVEVDDNSNFTRLYFVTDVNEDAGTLTVDLSFGYPANVNVSEPAEYTDFSKVLSQIMSGGSNLEDDQATEIEAE